MSGPTQPAARLRTGSRAQPARRGRWRGRDGLSGEPAGEARPPHPKLPGSARWATPPAAPLPHGPVRSAARSCPPPGPAAPRTGSSLRPKPVPALTSFTAPGSPSPHLQKAPWPAPFCPQAIPRPLGSPRTEAPAPPACSGAAAASAPRGASASPRPRAASGSARHSVLSTARTVMHGGGVGGVSDGGGPRRACFQKWMADLRTHTHSQEREVTDLPCPDCPRRGRKGRLCLRAERPGREPAPRTPRPAQFRGPRPSSCEALLCALGAWRAAPTHPRCMCPPRPAARVPGPCVGIPAPPPAIRGSRQTFSRWN